MAGRRLAGVHERRARGERFLERHRGRERLVVDVDELERGLGRRLVDRRDGGHRLALVAGDVDREHRPIAIRRPVVRIAPGEIGAGDRRKDARQQASARDVHPPDASVRIR